MLQYTVRMKDCPDDNICGYLECEVVAKSPKIAQRLAMDHVRHFWKGDTDVPYKASEFAQLVVISVRPSKVGQ